MNLPFAASSPVASQVPPSLGRAGIGTSPSRPATPAVGRGHAGQRVESLPPPAPKRPGGFASVLAAAQDQGEPLATASEDAARATNTGRVGAGERDAPDRVGEPGPVAVGQVVVDEPPSPGPAPTPWLLLSLSSGPHAWNSDSQMSPEAPGDALEAGLAAPGGHQAVGTDDPGARQDTAPPLFAHVAMTQVDRGVTGLSGAPEPVASEVSAEACLTQAEVRDVGDGGASGGAPLLEALTGARLPVPAAPEPGAPAVAHPPVVDGSNHMAGDVTSGAPDDVPPAAPDDVPSAVAVVIAQATELTTAGAIDTTPDLVEQSPAGTGAEVPAALAQPDQAPARASTTNDIVGRWLTATRRTGADVDVRLPGVADTPATPSLAIRQLVHLLDSNRPAEVAEAGAPRVPLTPDALPTPLAGSIPTARASEVLLRLAQAGEPAPRAARDPQPPAAMAVQMLASALAPAAVSEPVMAPAPAAPLPPAVGDQVMQQVVQSLRMQWKNGIGEAKVQLRPDALGSVSVTLRVEAGAVTAVVRAESPHVQEWVLQHQQTLRQQMESAGLRLDELVVSADDQHPQDEQQDAPPDQRRRSRGSRAEGPTDSARFEQLL